MIAAVSEQFLQNLPWESIDLKGIDLFSFVYSIEVPGEFDPLS